MNKILPLWMAALIGFFGPSAFAGPGGKIASTVFHSFWGRVLLAVLMVVLIPLVVYFVVQEKLAERRARRDLGFMAKHSSLFDWLRIQARAKDCFLRVHSGWETEDLSNVGEWMSGWYWQNQQMVFLDRWKRDGLKNVCNVQKISSVRPLLFVHRNEGQPHEDSMVVVMISASMNDYLKKRETGEIVEGSADVRLIETLWTFTVEDGSWKVADINEASAASDFIKMRNSLPVIESTLAQGERV